MRWILAVLALCTIQASALTVKVGVNYDNTVTTLYRAGEKPIAGGASPSGYTCDGVGNGSGEIDEVSATVWDFSVAGSSTHQNHFRCYKDGGNGDLELVAEAQANYTADGTIGNYGALGLGVREASGNTAWYFQVFAPHAGNTAVMCNYGTSAANATSADGLAGQSRPRFMGLTYDASEGDLRCWEKADGGSWTQIAQTFRTLSDDLVYAFGDSGSSTVTMAGQLTDLSIGSTITIYTPVGAPGGSDPQWDTPIGTQNWAQNSAITPIDVSAYCSISSGSKSFSGSGLPTGVSISSGGVISGTPTTASTGTATIQCSDGTNQTPEAFGWSVSAAQPGDTFTIGTGTSSFSCSAQGVGPGDTIVIDGTSRGSLTLSNCVGSSSNYIVIRNDTTESGQLVIGGTLTCDDCRYFEIDGTGKWAGAPAGTCGVSPSTLADGRTQCGIKVNSVSASTYSLVNLSGTSRDYIIEGLEIDGNWSGTLSDSSTGSDVGINPNDHAEQDANGVRANLIVRYNYIHHFSRECLYFGPNWSTAQGPNPWRLSNVRLHHNIVEVCGWDGIEMKSAIYGTNRIDHNHVNTVGSNNTSSGNNSRGISVYESDNTTVDANIIISTVGSSGAGPGIVCQTQNMPNGELSDNESNCYVYNNVVHGAKGPGISLSRLSGAENIAADIYNNTVVGNAGTGIQIGTAPTGGGFVRCNITDDGISVSNANWTSTNNISSAAQSNFTNYAGDDFSLSASASSAIDTCPSTVAPALDIEDTSRPVGAGDNIGAYENR